MRRFSFRLTLITLLAGAIGAVLRHFELLTAFEQETGLAKPWSPLTIVLGLFVLLYAAYLFLSVRRAGGLAAGEGYESAFSYRSAGKLTALILCAAILFASAVLCFLGSQNNGGVKAEIVVLGFLAAMSAVCSIVLSVAAYRGEDRGGLAFCSIVIVAFYCFLLTVLYKNRAADPVILDYIYELFAVCSALLAVFFSAGSACGRTRPLRTMFFCQLGVFFSIITLTDGHSMWMTGICVFTAAYLTLNGYSFMKGLRKPRREEPAPLEAEQPEPEPPEDGGESGGETL